MCTRWVRDGLADWTSLQQENLNRTAVCLERQRLGRPHLDRSRVARAVLDKAGDLLLGASVRTMTEGQSTTLNVPDCLRR